LKKDTKTFRVVVLGGLTLASASIPAFTVGCGDDGDFPREGPDAMPFDAGFPREGADASPPPPPFDAGFDGGMDASADADLEAGTDAGDGGDAGDGDGGAADGGE
jgi:hypothetical protein